jgi:hypothetical protein
VSAGATARTRGALADLDRDHEDHLLICSECRDRLQAEIVFVAAMREVVAKIRETDRRLSP